MRSSVCISIIAMAFLCLLLSCAPTQIPDKNDVITIQLKYRHQAQFAGLYIADQKGYFSDHRISAIFTESSADTDIIQQVISGRAHFGIDAADKIILHRSEGFPIRAIAGIYRKSPVVFISHKDSGIKKPADLTGKKVAAFGEAEIQLKAMMRKLNLDFNSVTIEPFDPEYTTFYKRDVDATYTYSVAGLIRIRNSGYDVNVIWPGDYGINFYSDTLFTTDALIENNPELIYRCTNAVIRGYHDAVGSTELAVRSTMKYAPGSDPLLQTQMMEASIPFIHTGESPIGWMTHDDWEHMNKTLQYEGILNNPVDTEKIYSMRFLNEIYGDRSK